MKANELMIGDWVQNPLGWKAQVQSIRFVNTIKDEWEWLIKIGINNETFQDHLSLTEIEPIPLAPEILEKNGFKKYGDTGWWLEDDYYDVQIYEWSDSIWVARYESNEMNCPHEQLTMSYIHELQRFLKAVGIEKEIIV